MSLRLKKAARALRVLYGATKPLSKPPGRYHLKPTDDEQMREFEAAQRRDPDYEFRRRSGVAADRAFFRRGT